MQKRYILWWMFLFLLLCNTFVTLNISLAIVSMVGDTRLTETDKSDQNITITCPNTTFYWSDDNDNFVKNSIQVETYNWTEYEKNTVLSAYLSLSWLAILPGGVLAQKFGSKIVTGYSLLISAVMSSFMPLAADFGPHILTGIRMIQGVISFVAVPGSYLTIMGNWSPPEERGMFMSVFLIGSTLGLGVGSFIFGCIAQYLHWKYIFHFTSLCGLVWTYFWYTLVYDSPDEHPTITLKEREYIKCSLQNSISKEKLPIPWLRILTSIPLWLIILSASGFTWHFFMLTMYMPSYLKTTYGLNSNQIGIITSIPQFICGLTAYLVGKLSDYVIDRKWLSIHYSRKLYTLIGVVGGAIPLVVIVYTHCNINKVIWNFIVAIVVRNLSTFGVELAIVDISPKFCGVLLALIGTLTSFVVMALSSVVSYLSVLWSPDNLWRMVFLFTAKLHVLLSVLYLICGTSNVQPWNDSIVPRSAYSGENDEPIPLKSFEQTTDD